MKFVRSLVYMVLALVGAQAAAAQDASRCLEVQNSLERLACYDDIYEFQIDDADTDESEMPALWMFFESADEFNGRNNSYVVLNSDKANLRSTDAPIATVVRCKGNGTTEVYVIAGGYIGARNERIPVRYKFGDADPINERWSESTDGKAAFLPGGFRDFRAGLASGESYIFEITDFRGSRYLATFPATSLSDEFDFVMSGCAAG